MMYDWMLHQGYAPIIIATKADKVARTQITRHIEMIKKGLAVEEGTIVLPFSAETKQGKDEIWELIDRFVLTPEEIEQEKAQEQKKAQDKKASGGVQTSENGKKPRWKATGKPVAKKTAKNAMRKAQRKAGGKK